MRAGTPISNLSPEKIDRLINRYGRALASHHRDGIAAAAADRGDFIAAFDTCLNMLVEIEAIVPENKRAKVRALIETYGHEMIGGANTSTPSVSKEPDREELENFLRSIDAQIKGIRMGYVCFPT